MRLSVVKPPHLSIVRASSRRSGLLPSREAAEAALDVMPVFRSCKPSGVTLAGPSKFRHCLTTFYPWWRVATHQLQHALDRGARRSICYTVPAGTRRPSERRPPVCARALRRVLIQRLQLRTLRHDPVLDKAPQRNDQPPGHGDNPDAPTSPAGATKPLHKPGGEATVRLPPQPAPRQLDADAPQLGAARFANPLVLDPLIAPIGHGHQPGQRAELSRVAKRAGGEQLRAIQARARLPHATQATELLRDAPDRVLGRGDPPHLR